MSCSRVDTGRHRRTHYRLRAQGTPTSEGAQQLGEQYVWCSKTPVGLHLWDLVISRASVRSGRHLQARAPRIQGSRLLKEPIPHHAEGCSIPDTEVALI